MYGKRPPVNWLDPSKYVLSSEVLPSGYYEEYEAYRAGGGTPSNLAFKMERNKMLLNFRIEKN